MVSAAIDRAQPRQTEQIDGRRLLWAGPLTATIAAAANAVVYFIARAVGTLSDTVVVPGANQPITLAPVVSFSFLQVLLAAVVLAVIARFAQRPVRTFRIVATVVLLLSFLQPPLLITGAPVSFILTLELMHIVAGVIAIGLLTTLPRKA